MREFFVLIGIALNAIALALVYTSGDTVSALCLGLGGAVSVLVGMFLNDILRAE